ncbi:hypothetical protein AB0O16_07300 [Microbacterium sp. NPDC089180]|uniref:hypothetical protein n=1 Tax=unclassified Microbacterium TaxID=2609290 RepID=UPI00343F8AF0
MSYFMFDQSDTEALIVTDTLVTDIHDHPAMFAHKVWALPTMNLAIALTGTSTVGDERYRCLSTVHGPRDIVELDGIAPDLLRAIHARVQHEHGPIGSSTVYVFGCPTGTSQLVRYTYRSVMDYESSSETGAATAVRPAPETFEAEYPETREDFVQLAVRVRDENDSGASPEPVAIGGDLFLTTVRDGLIGTEHLYRFADYEEHLAAMNGRNS